MTVIPDQKFYKDFFETWKNLPALWKIKSHIYKNRTEKNIAWEKLLRKYKEIDSSANLETLKIKLKNIRTCYRNEIRKIENKKINNSGAEELQAPMLWYLNELEFLKDQGKSSNRSSTLDSDEEKERGETSQKFKRRKIIRPPQLKDKNETLNKSIKMLDLKKRRDDAAIYADCWAVSFRKMNSLQKIYAKKAIEEILIYGQLGKLTLHSVKVPSSSSPELLSVSLSSSSISSLNNEQLFGDTDHQIQNDEYEQQNTLHESMEEYFV